MGNRQLPESETTELRLIGEGAELTKEIGGSLPGGVFSEGYNLLSAPQVILASQFPDDL